MIFPYTFGSLPECSVFWLATITPQNLLRCNMADGSNEPIRTSQEQSCETRIESRNRKPVDAKKPVKLDARGLLFSPSSHGDVYALRRYVVSRLSFPLPPIDLRHGNTSNAIRTSRTNAMRTQHNAPIQQQKSRSDASTCFRVRWSIVYLSGIELRSSLTPTVQTCQHIAGSFHSLL